MEEEVNSQLIIVAGMGRCGTTLLFDALRNYHDFMMDIANVNNDDFIQHQVIKTHDFAPDRLPDNAKVIYMFGNPIHIVLSAHYNPQLNLAQHYTHLKADVGMKHNHVTQDTLRLGDNFDSWTGAEHPYDVLFLRYETMWEEANRKILDEFVGFHVQLPEYKERTFGKDKASFGSADKLHTTYGDLLDRVNQMPTAKIEPGC